MEKERVKEDIIFSFVQKLRENTKDKIYISPFGLQSVVITKPFKKEEKYYFLYHNVPFCIQYQPDMFLKIEGSNEIYAKETQEKTLLELLKEIVNFLMKEEIENPVLVYEIKDRTVWIYKSKRRYEEFLKKESFMTLYDCISISLKEKDSELFLSKVYQKKI